nr:protein pxr1-like [Ipomoea batatas]
MVVALGPGKFYGKSLPRPRIYTDVKFNEERVDPPVPVFDPLMSWAEEAHWSMGGLSFKRHRLQGRIEGNISKLRAEHEKQVKKLKKNSPSKSSSPATGFYTPSPPPAPIAVKRKRRLIDEEEEEGSDEARRGWPARKLGDDFDRVAYESGLIDSDAEETIAARTRRQKAEKAAVEAEVVTKVKSKGLKRLKKGVKKSVNRSSPRLAKRESP